MPRSQLFAAAAAVMAALALTACAAPQPTAPQRVDSEEPAVDNTPEASFDAFDFGNVEWSFVPHAEGHPPVSISVVDGTAEVDGVQYTVVSAEILFSDADGDGDDDAIVPIEAFGGGNSIDRQWYLWANREGEAVQVELPVARTVHCGTATESVSAVDGGFEIHEFRRATGEEAYLACTDRGSDERVRTVGLTEHGPNGALWPTQLAPFPAYGGICPTSIEYDAYPLSADINLYAVPSTAEDPIPVDGMYEWRLDEWPIYSATLPEWVLLGVRTESALGCAWAPRG